MFNRNPYIPKTSDTLHEVDADNTSVLSRILDAIKEADKIVETKTTSVGQVMLCNRKTIKFYAVIFILIYP